MIKMSFLIKREDAFTIKKRDKNKLDVVMLLVHSDGDFYIKTIIYPKVKKGIFKKKWHHTWENIFEYDLLLPYDEDDFNKLILQVKFYLKKMGYIKDIDINEMENFKKFKDNLKEEFSI